MNILLLSYSVVTARNPLDALATLRMQKFDLVITDLHMPIMDGLELQKHVKEEFKLPVISKGNITLMTSFFLSFFDFFNHNCSKFT